MNMSRLRNAFIMAVVFLVISWGLPIGYYAFAPQDQIATIDSTTLEAEQKEYHLYTDYYSTKQWQIEYHATLYLERGNGTGTAVEQWQGKATFQPGSNTMNLTLDPAKNISPGIYSIGITITIKNHIYTRIIEHQSDPMFLDNRIITKSPRSPKNTSQINFSGVIEGENLYPPTELMRR